jgi:hypothetical protein
MYEYSVRKIGTSSVHQENLFRLKYAEYNNNSIRFFIYLCATQKPESQKALAKERNKPNACTQTKGK